MKDNELAEAVGRLACSIEMLADELRNQNGQQAILSRIAQMETKIMSAISDFGETVNTRFDELGTAVDGVAADVDFLKAEIKKLQDNPGPITPADQAILDGIQARADALSEKVKALDTATENPPTPV